MFSFLFCFVLAEGIPPSVAYLARPPKYAAHLANAPHERWPMHCVYLSEHIAEPVSRSRVSAMIVTYLSLAPLIRFQLELFVRTFAASAAAAITLSVLARRLKLISLPAALLTRLAPFQLHDETFRHACIYQCLFGLYAPLLLSFFCFLSSSSSTPNGYN